MRIVFVTVYDPENYGVRCLIAQLNRQKHETYFLQLKNHMQIITTETPKREPQLLSYANGKLVVTDQEANPITKVEQALFAETLARLKPDIIGFSQRGVLEHLFPLLTSIARKACPSALQITGGVGPTLNAAFYLTNGADIVIRGEGEDALAELLDALEMGHRWQDIANVAYLREGQVVCNRLRALEKNLSRFPIPWQGKDNIYCIEDETCTAAAMCDTNTQRNPLIPLNTFHCITSRGCLGSCSYCSAKNLRLIYQDEIGHCPKMRVRSMAHLFEELHDIKQRGATRIYIHDDFFVRPLKEMHEFLDRYTKEINIPFYAYFHPVQLLHDPTLVPKAIAAGCATFSFGIQHACESFCTKVYKRKFFTRRYKELFELIMEHGGNVSIHFIGGNPLETEEDFEANVRFAGTIPYDASSKTMLTITIFYLMYLPGAELTAMFPQIQKLPRSMLNFVCKCLLLDIRRMTTERHFKQVINDVAVASSPPSLYRLRANLIRDAHNKYLFAQVERLQGKKIYFWGCGDIYTFRKYLFDECLPQAILVDVPYSGPSHVDGIAVMHPDDVLLSGEVNPIIIFSKEAVSIYKKILIKYPNYKDIIICKAC